MTATLSTLSAATLKAIMPKSDADTWAPPLSAAMAEFDIVTPARAAAFLAQLAHESIQLTHVEEDLYYSAARLLAVFPARFNAESAKLYEHDPEKLGNFLYSHRNGNGDALSGDGYRFRGRGPMQLTGRYNYTECGNALALALVATPDMVTAPMIGSRTAAWFWHSKGLNGMADDGKFLSITKAINGGVNGHPERLKYWDLAKKVLGA